MDCDLEEMLDSLWRKKPKVTVDYMKIKAMLMIVQELRLSRK